MKRSRMQSLGVWATEVEIIAAASLLNATIYVYAQCGDSYKWLKHSADEANCGLHQDECICITNLNENFETVKKMLRFVHGAVSNLPAFQSLQCCQYSL